VSITSALLTDFPKDLVGPPEAHDHLLAVDFFTVDTGCLTRLYEEHVGSTLLRHPSSGRLGGAASQVNPTAAHLDEDISEDHRSPGAVACIGGAAVDLFLIPRVGDRPIDKE
jgi:hypothetical protein